MLMDLKKVICPGCGLEADSEDDKLDDRYNASSACRRVFDELSAFTLSLRDKDFINQVAIDIYTAQHIGPKVKPIGTVFALIGLYLVFERGYSGRQVQLAHMTLSKTRRQWPHFDPPAKKSTVTVGDVVMDLTQQNHREKIYAWGKAVWELWRGERENIERLITNYLTI